jgi:large subunit ribosomal protein L6
MSTKNLETSFKLPEGVTVRVENGKLYVEGAKGRVVKDLSHIPADMKVENGVFYARLQGRSRKTRALLGTIISIVKNAVTGVTKGYTYRLKVVSSHFPITVKVVGREVLIENFIGERYARRADIVGDVKVTVKQDEVIVSGIDKEAVGQTAANIEQATKISRKDPRKFLDGIYVAEKVVG